MLCMQMRNYDPPEVTLSALTETGRDESTIPVLKQQSFTGTKVIPSALADTPCVDLGVHGVFEKLNTILGTSFSLSPIIISVLDSTSENNGILAQSTLICASTGFALP